MEYALKMNSINKGFSGVPVLKNVDFSVEKGKIHALLGENGAGKTTLMNILGGVISMDSGSIELFGDPVKISNPAEAQKNRVAFIHQELNVVNDLFVYENMFLGHELHKGATMDASTMIQKTKEVFERMHVEIDPRAMMGDLQASYKQIVEIAKSVLMDAKLIIMDEPTTSLTQPEVENVFSIMRNLIEEHDVTIIFISHKLGEVVEFCDYYTVLRNGEMVGTHPIKSENGELAKQADIARMMVGKSVMDVEVYKPHEIGEVILKASDLCIEKHVDHVSFDLHAGEILGITGLLGDGKDELVRGLFGDMPFASGTIEKNGKVVKYNHPAKAKKAGIGMLPSNRKENAIIKDLTVMQNMTIVTLDQYKNGLSLSRAKESKVALEYKEKLNIKVDNLANLITSLSGGNQQKVVLAKWLTADPDIMILSNPTQGVDVGAKNEIYGIIMELAKAGMGIIVTSGEAQEILKICDRVLVMYHGVLKGELQRSELSEEAIMILSTGGILD
ncbi:sugar ABC transporter ATP-binding protein [Christensenella intestinihominis]|uniref:sugar ABC transporter ATP-binding protein n=1 Tax=Christensenella intestinihominis TaxID=1851429 RepID=UPI00082E3A58|nr:sugar ABC transporter ATP-binding protein [Christensenella intestinihominis]